MQLRDLPLPASGDCAARPGSRQVHDGPESVGDPRLPRARCGCGRRDGVSGGVRSTSTPRPRPIG